MANSESQIQNEQSQSKYLGVYLQCQNKSTNTDYWYCNVKAIYRIVSQKKGVDDFVKCDREAVPYDADNRRWGYSSLITIDGLLDRKEGFIKDDTVILQVDLKVETLYGTQQDDEARSTTYMDIIGPLDKKQLFSSSTDYQWDFVLNVQGKQVHIQKNLLSMHSEYFKNQFAKNKESKTAMLHNVNYEELIELLSVIYPTLCTITVENVEAITKLSYIFNMSGVLLQCEAILMVNSSKFGKLRTFLMSHWYGMEHLQAKCVAEVKAIGDPKELRMELEYAVLDCRTKAILLDKIVESSPSTNHVEISDQASGARASDILAALASSALVPSDGVVVVESHKISIHKMHLAMYSEYFKAMFLDEFKDNHLSLQLSSNRHISKAMFASFVTGILFAALVNAELQLPGPPPNWDGVPPGFDSVLSSDVIEQLKDVYKNQQLSMMEKKEQFDKIMDSVDPATLAKLPLPPFFNALPKDVQEKLKAIHSDTEMKWSERAPKFMQIMDSLPEDMKPHFGPPPPPPSSAGAGGGSSGE
ncbi:BTB/POZ domain-containing protein [Ditylenchus destructor]|uniref:BTB/POZ domain-containing protein n=1 Tax=Ditylenchus destructor TaxID=166010 RepID=A0AAD4MHS6_9BILA|nr:BTB/POZ domain-containing protein [Ditylenchus destructor]